MGTFHIELRIANISKCSQNATLRKVVVDTRSELTWVPEKVLEAIGVKREKKDLVFSMANGEQITRATGFAHVRVGEYFTVDEVVFAEEGDLTLLGARTLGGMNLMVDPPRK
jgi:predicted aspartyl protease